MVLHQIVNIDADFARRGFVVVNAHHDTAGIDVIDRAATTRLHRRAGIDRHGALKPGTDQRFLGTQTRHGLALHVGTHQCAVGVIVFQERDQRCRHRHGLRRCHVHVFDAVWRRQRKFVVITRRHQFVGEPAVLVELGVRLRDHVTAFFNGREVIDLAGHFAVHHLAIRCLKETVVVGTSVNRQRVDQADVRAFRCFNRTHTPIVRRMHVAHLETRAFACQSAWSQRGYAALVRDLRQRVSLVHELRQLAGTKKLANSRRHRFGVD